jgi:hypothetical protein
MNDFLGQIVARTLGQTPSVTPRLATVFEPAQPQRLRGLIEERQEVLADSPRPSTPPPPTPEPGPPARSVDTVRVRQAFEEKAETAESRKAFEVPASVAHEIPPPPAPVAQPLSSPGSLVERTTSIAPAAQPLSSPQPVVERARSIVHVEKAEPPRAVAPVFVERIKLQPPAVEVPPPREKNLEPSVEVRIDSPKRVPTAVSPPAPIRPKIIPARTESALPISKHPEPTHEEPPEIHVTIGRIDVRAIVSPPPVPARTTEPKRIPPLSLDDYFKRRTEVRP